MNESAEGVSNPSEREEETDFSGPPLTRSQQTILQVSVLIVALCGIVYELIIATIASYLLGDSVYQFSLTIGLFMFAMGMGSLITRRFAERLIEWFIATEILVAFVGGLSSIILFVVFPWTFAFKPVMYTLILLIGGLVGLEIPLLMRILSESGGFRKSIAQVLALDYFGALVGSVSFPLLLLPFLGLFRASFGIGLLNGLIALINVYAFGKLIRWPLAWKSLTILCIGLLGIGVGSASLLKSFAQGQLYADLIVFQQQTPYQNIVLTCNEMNGEHRLYVDGHLQFAERDEYRYHEALVHPALTLSAPGTRVLILGGGDGLAAREVLKHDSVQSIDLVDIDPAITRLCREFEPVRKLNQGALEHPRLTIHHQDAFTFLQEPGSPYDCIIIDLPDPHNEALSKLYSVEFYNLVGKKLKQDGCFVTQSSSPWVTRQAFWSIAKTIEAAGFRTTSYHVVVPNFGDWGFQLAARETPRIPEIKIEVPTRFLNPEVLDKSTLFARDESRVDTPVNSIFEPRLYLLYQEEIKQ
ncbi:MAG: polyamine aminopropyltransferase [Planctomycetota bacterium]|nr:polyamine aminopropyltransferase [Planctomycetota bacterium]